MKKNVAYLLTIFFIVSCSDSENTESNSENVEQKKYEWRLVTSWPKNYPGLEIGRAHV